VKNLAYLRKQWKRLNDALEWRGITWKDMGYVVFCLGSLSAMIALLLAALLSGLI